MVNDDKPIWVTHKISQYIDIFGERRIVLFGATYKENISDLRESPSLKISSKLRDNYGYEVAFVEPNLNCHEVNGFSNIKLEDVDYLNDLCVILVKHEVFLQKTFKPKHIIDTVGLIIN